MSLLNESVIYSDYWKENERLVNYGTKEHYRAKHRLSKFKGIKRDNFLLHLKECEFRFNNKENLYQILLKLIRENPLKLS